MTIGEIAEKYEQLLDEKQKATEVLSAIKERFAVFETQLIRALQDAGVDGTKTASLSLSLNEKVVPKITDHEAFCTWCSDNARWDFLKRSCNVRPFDEMVTTTGELPHGVEADSVVKLNYRRIK